MDFSAPDTLKEFEIRNVIALLRRQLRVMVLTVIAVFAVAGLYLISTTATYTATALLIVDPDSNSVLETVRSFPSSAGRENARVDSEVEILRSNAVALAVIENNVLTQDPEFGAKQTLRTKLTHAVGIANAAPVNRSQLISKTLERFKRAVTIRRRGLTYLIAVSATSRSPLKATLLANSITQAYVKQQVQVKVSASLSAKQVLEEQMISSRKDLSRYETALDDFIENNFDQIGSSAQQDVLAGLRQQLMNEQIGLGLQQTALGDARQLLQQENWTLLGDKLGDPELVRLGDLRRAQFSGMTATKQGLNAINAQQGIAELDADLSRKSELGLQSMSVKIQQLDQTIAGLRNQLRRSVLSSELSPIMLAEVYSIQQETKIARDQYQSLLSRMRDLETQARIQIADSRVVSQAIEPVNASFPNKNLVFLVALATAMGVGVSFAFLSEYYIGGFTSESQLGDFLKTSVAASIPQNIEQNSSRLSIADNIVDAPLSIYSESVRKLRATIDQNFWADPGANQTPPIPLAKVVLVSSALPAEGKSTTALALARSYAQSGRKTLLIDADLRKPSLHRHLGFEPAFGFLDYLQNPSDTDLSSAFYARDPASTLALIMGAKRSVLPTDQLLNSPSFDTLLSQAKEVYDVVIIDSPPLLPVVDARYIAHSADAVVLVVKWAATNQSDLKSAVYPLVEAMKQGAALVPVLGHVRGKSQKSIYGGYGDTYSAAI